MAEPLGIAPLVAASLAPAAPVIPPVTIPPTIVPIGAELLTPPPEAFQLAGTLAVTVLSREPDGTNLLRAGGGTTLRVKASQPLAAGTRLNLRLQSGPPPSVLLLDIEEPAEPPAGAGPSMELDFGTTLGATVRGPPPGDPAAALSPGTQLVLRIIAVPQNAEDDAGPGLVPGPLLGQIIDGGGEETLVETPLGTLALDSRLALPPGTLIAFEMLEETAPAVAPPAPAPASGWPALDEALEALATSAPTLAQQLRAELSPTTAPALAGTLLFLMGTLYSGRWPGPTIASLLSATGQDSLKIRLEKDAAELDRMSRDPATGEWRVFALPLLAGPTIQPVRLYLRRRGAGGETEPEPGSRFVVEADLGGLGPMQFDGLVRGPRFDLVLRSHGPLPAALRQEARRIFHRASAAAGLAGDILFATAPQFAVVPLAGLAHHIAVSA